MRQNPNLEKYRTDHSLPYRQEGSEGTFIIPHPVDRRLRIVAISTVGGGWEHVSVSIHRKQRVPTWEEMCFVKDLFFEPDETVMQLHPPQSLYINEHRYVLHLWKPIGIKIPLPPPLMVGRPGVSHEEAEREVINIKRRLKKIKSRI